MKKILNSLFSAFCIAALFVSCQKDDVSFDERLLIGKWNSGTVFYRYDSNYMGARWDTSDDVSEEEGTKFRWKLTKAELEITYIGEHVGEIPDYYTITELTATTLKYKDYTGRRYSFVKVDDD